MAELKNIENEKGNEKKVKRELGGNFTLHHTGKKTEREKHVNNLYANENWEKWSSRKKYFYVFSDISIFQLNKKI